MNRTIRQTALIAIGLLAAAAAPALTLDAVRVQNPAGDELDASFVEAYTSLRAGRELADEAAVNAAVARDVDSLRESDRFSFVRAALEKTGERLTLVYTVTPRLRLSRIIISGADQLGNRKLREQIDLAPGDFIDDAVVGETIRETETWLRRNKYPQANIDWTIEPDRAAGTADLLVRVDEGSKMRVNAIHFESPAVAEGSGLLKRLTPSIFPSREKRMRIHERDLRKVIRQKKTWWITPWFGVYHPEYIEHDRAMLRDFFGNRGYLDVSVEGPDVSDTGDGQLELTYRIDAGPRYRLGQVSLEGASVYSNRTLLSQTDLTTEQTASQQAAQQAADAIQRYYGNRGYLLTAVQPDFSTDPDSGLADLVLRVREGERASIHRINIRGNEVTRDEVIRRELSVYPGEPFNQRDVQTSERRLQNLGFFESVVSEYTENTEAEPVGEMEPYDLTFNVNEKSMGSFLVGAGFSSVDDLVGFAEVTHGNFDIRRWPPFGDGQKIKVRVQAGTERNDAEVSFIEPWFLGKRLSLGTDLYYRNAGYYSDDFQLRTLGGRLSLGRGLTPFVRGSLSYSLESLRVYDVDAPAGSSLLDEEGTRTKSTLGFSLSRDTRDSFYMASRGNYSSGGLELSGGPLAGDTDIYKLQARSSQYWPVLEDHVFNLKGAVATVDAYGGSDRVPIFDRLFLGGPRTIRAFAYRDVSPRDPVNDDEPDGGLTSWYATAEYTVPLWEQIRAAGFYDIGAVSADSFDFFESDLNSGYGLGVRFDLPMFPLRLDYAFPHLTDENNENAAPRWNFLLGYTF